MVTHTEPTRPTPPLRIDIDAVVSRLAVLAEVALCPDCELPLTQVTADLVEVLIEVTRLFGAVIAARRQSANRLAAIRAALRAEAEGEADPLGFLRDEIADPAGGRLPGEDRGWWG